MTTNTDEIPANVGPRRVEVLTCEGCPALETKQESYTYSNIFGGMSTGIKTQYYCVVAGRKTLTIAKFRDVVYPPLSNSGGCGCPALKEKK